MGESEVTGLGAPDMFHANMIAREMILSAGFNKKLGPVSLMQVRGGGVGGEMGALVIN